MVDSKADWTVLELKLEVPMPTTRTRRPNNKGKIRKALKAFGLDKSDLANATVLAYFLPTNPPSTQAELRKPGCAIHELGNYKLVDICADPSAVVRNRFAPGADVRCQHADRFGNKRVIGAVQNHISIGVMLPNNTVQHLGIVRMDGVFIYTVSTDPREFIAWLQATDTGDTTERVHHDGPKLKVSSRELTVIAYHGWKMRGGTIEVEKDPTSKPAPKRKPRTPRNAPVEASA